MDPDTCAALVDSGNGDDYTHCVTLSLTDGEDPDSNFDVTFNGPDIYYNFICSSGAYYYYSGTRNFSGTASGTLNDRDISFNIGDLMFTGTVSEDFTTASGEIEFTGSSFSTGSDAPTSRQFDCSNGYGANWEVELNGSGCEPGAGVNDSIYYARVDDGFCDEEE